MEGRKIGEIVGQLRLGERIDPEIEVLAGSADGAGIGVDGFRLQALELEMLAVGLIRVVELSRGPR